MEAVRKMLMRIRTFDGSYSHHHDDLTLPYSYSCPFVDPKGKHCIDLHGFRKHVEAGMNGLMKVDGKDYFYWKLCGPCWRKMKGSIYNRARN